VVWHWHSADRQTDRQTDRRRWTDRRQRFFNLVRLRRYLAELAILLLTEVSLELLEAPFGEADRAAIEAPLPDPMLPNNFERRAEVCFASRFLQSFINEEHRQVWGPTPHSTAQRIQGTCRAYLPMKQG
jgi:hypothetical protein